MTKIFTQAAKSSPPFGQAVFTIKQAAQALQVSPKTIYNALNAGKIHSVLILGARRIPAEEIHRLILMGTAISDETVETSR